MADKESQAQELQKLQQKLSTVSEEVEKLNADIKE